MTAIDYFIALFLTLLIEGSVVFLLGYRAKKFYKAVLLVNFATHPLLSYLLWIGISGHFFYLSYLSATFLEVIVALVEAWLLAFALKKSYISMLKLSLVMNAVSFIVGLFIF